VRFFGFELFASKKKAEKIDNELAQASFFVGPGGGMPRPSTFSLRNLIDEGYRKNVVVNVCINEIATSVSEPEIIVRNRKTQTPVPDDHPLKALLDRPKKNESKFSFFERGLVHLQAAGAMYIHKDRARSGVVSLTLMRPDRVAPVPGANGEVEAYDYTVGESYPQRIPAADVIAITLPDPLDDYNGLPPLMAAAKYCDLDNEMAEYMRAFFMNGGVPAGLLKLKTPASREERERMQDQWAERYGRGTGATSKWHRIGVITADAEYQEVGTSPDKLRLDNVWGMTETRLCATFGVPPQIVQMRIGMQYSTYENYETAVRTFWQETLLPMYARIDEKLTTELAPEFDEELEIVFDLEHVQALQEAEDAKIERAVKLFTAGIITRSRALERIGEKPIPNEPDVILIPQTAKEVGKPLPEAAPAPVPGQQPGQPPKPGEQKQLPSGQKPGMKLLTGGKEKKPEPAEEKTQVKKEEQAFVVTVPASGEWHR
jgi:HK97 family phage portal protein